ncbi:MAG: hypothetical protein ABI680_03205 [Chthoniobacteraceae bacterium]
MTPATEPDAPFASDEAPVDAVFSAWQIKNPLQRAAEMETALGALESSQFAQVVENVAGIEEWDRQDVLTALLAKWAQKDPAAEVAWLRPLIGRFYTGGTKKSDTRIMDAWRDAAPEQIIAVALERPDAPVSQELIGDAIHALAGDDPARQFDRMAALPEGRMRDTAIAAALGELAKADPSGALARLDSVSDGAGRDSTLTNILTEWANKEPAAALAELSRRIDAGDAGAGRGNLGGVICAAAVSDPTTALAWAEGLPDDLREGAKVMAAMGWIRRDPISALDWSRDQGFELDQNPFLRGDRSSLLNAAMNSDKEKTTEWLRGLPASPERDRYLAGHGLFGLGPNAACDMFEKLSPEAQEIAAGAFGNWFVRLGEDESVTWIQDKVTGPARAMLITSTVSTCGNGSTERLETLVAKYPSGSDRDAALRGAVWSTNDQPGEALNYAERISDPVAREQTFRWFAGSWLRKDRAAARAWLVGTTELAPDVKAMLIREVTDN